jgi:DNA adenine methylase
VNGVLYRWAGSKAQILPELMAHLDKSTKYRRWVEPFLGGGSVALEAMRRGLAQEYVLGDSLRPIVDTWHQLQRDPTWLITELRQFVALPFEQQRVIFIDQRNGPEVNFESLCARRLMILQACSFNGLWRESVKSGYNVPFGLETKSGKRSAPHLNFEALAEAAKLLSANQVRVFYADFAETIAQAGEGDLVYADPPYLDTHSAYRSTGFGLEEHQRLAQALIDAKKRGVVCWVSGSAGVATRAVYVDCGAVPYELSARRSIGCKVASRGVKTEILIRM